MSGAALDDPGRRSWVSRARAAGVGGVLTGPGCPRWASRLTSFALAQHLGGSGFIACFAGGAGYSAPVSPTDTRCFRGAEGAGDVLSLLTWVVFGALVVLQVSVAVSGAVLVYAILSLTLVRMLPVWLCLAGAGVDARDRLFIGWFGPRGLASVVFGVMILAADLEGGGTIAATIVCTVFLSVISHGASATPLIRAFGASRSRAKAGSARNIR